MRVVLASLYGLCFVGPGFFVKKYPGTIAGYDTLSPERKKKAAVDGLSFRLKKMLIVAGIAVFVVFLIVRIFVSMVCLLSESCSTPPFSV
jgi:hypothetical protein